MRKVKLGRVDAPAAHAWYRRARSIPDHPSLLYLRHSRGNPWDFMKALVNLTLPTKEAGIIPHTFLFDEERLIKLRSDMLDLINLEVCMFHFHCLQASNKSSCEARFLVDESPNTSFVSSPLYRPASPEESTIFSSPTIPSPHDFSSPKRRRSRIKRRSDRDIGATRTSSPRTDPFYSAESNLISSSTSSLLSPEASSYPTHFLSQQAIESTVALRSSLLAILTSAPATLSAKQKWAMLAPDLALQVLRSTTTPLTQLQQFEGHLASHLSECQSRVFQVVEKCVVLKLLPELHTLVETYTPKSTYQIFEAATAPRFRSRSSPSTGPKEDIVEMATRIAHLGILHWQVWGEWFYQQELDEFYAMIMMQS